MKDTIISLSGGLDSTTLLAFLLDQNYKVEGISFKYGSTHNKYELESARVIAKHYHIQHSIIDITSLFAGFDSALMRDNKEEIPHGHYESETMKRTVVPGRNMIFISILAALAESKGIRTVTLGVHSGDHAIYPDCRPIFCYHIGNAITASSEDKVTLLTPFLNYDKDKIILKGEALLVPYHLTRTCYENQEIACGKCGSCIERLEAFQKCGLIDPIRYAE